MHQSLSKTVPNSFIPLVTCETPKVASEIENDAQETSEKRISDNIQAAIAKRKELQEAGEMRSPAEKFLDEPRAHKAIKRFCYECNGYSTKDANDCQNKNCALWLFRKGKTSPAVDELPIWQKAHRRWLKKAGEL